MRHAFVRAIAVGSALAAAGPCLAQEPYPVRPIRLIAAIAAGSLTDVVVRRMASGLAAGLGQSVIVDNRPGANTIVGADACAKAQADGYTYCVLNRDTVSVIPHIASTLPYDAAKDLRPVTALYQIVQGVVVSASLPVTTVAELRTYATAQPKALNFGTFGAGSNPDVARQWLNETWGVQIVGVPYKGANLILNALLGGEIQLTRISLGSVATQVRAGRLRILAIGSTARSPALPDVPTYAQAGLGDSPEGLWWGVFAPARVPETRVTEMAQRIAAVFRDPRFLEYLQGEFLEPMVASVAEFAAFVDRDRRSGAAMVRRFNIPRE